MANPIETIIPVFNKVFLFFYLLVLILILLLYLYFSFILNFFSTIKSQKIIIIIPNITPIITFAMLLIPSASGISSKQIIDVIKPDASESMKLKNLFEFLFNVTPNIPPKVVPNVPKNKPISVVLIISFIFITSSFLLYLF